MRLEIRRSKLDIYFVILEVINRGVKKPTQIMYKTNTSWKVLQEMFETLIKGGFLREEITKNNQKIYYITEKGKSALYYNLKSLEGFKVNNKVLLVKS